MSEQLKLWNDDPILHNVFFAARPDAATAACIAHLAQDVVESRHLAAKPLPPERLHVSLFAVGGFEGACPPAVIDAAIAVAGTVPMAPFEVAFDRVASFGGGKGKRALVLTGREGVTGLVRFQQALSSAMFRAGVGVRQRTQFTPHLTMIYTDQVCEFWIEPMSWTFDEFILIDSLHGRSRHVLLGRWPR